jgi:tripartite-type tricarboxylate transporter receptor subunit TctC
MLKNLNRISVLLLIIVLILTAAGCSGKNNPTTKATEKQTTTTKAPGSTTKPTVAEIKYPESPITIIVPQKAGGSTDKVYRNLQPFLSQYIGAPIVIENVTGSSGKLGLAQAYSSPNDGYVLLAGVYPAWQLTQSIDENPKYDVNEMVSIYGFTSGDFNCFVVPYDSPYQTMEELIEAAKQGSITVAGSGIGGNGYYAYYLMSSASGGDFEFVPYDSGSEAVMSAIGSHVDCAVTSVISVINYVKDKQLRVLCTTGTETSSHFPDVPTLKDLGYDYGFNVFMGLNAPPGTDQAIIDKLEAAMAEVLKDQQYIDACEAAQINVSPMSAKEYDQLIKDTAELLKSTEEGFIAATKAAQQN